MAVSQAFHSPLLLPIVNEFRSVAASFTYNKPKLNFISNLTGKSVESIDADYWVKHLCNTVRWRDGVQSLSQLGITTFLEIGPKPVLTNLSQQTLRDNHFEWLSCMKSQDTKMFYETLTTFYSQGSDIQWHNFHSGANSHKKIVDAPCYPFQREYYWVDDKLETPKVPVVSAVHPMLGKVIPTPNFDGTVYETVLHPNTPDFIQDHIIYDLPLVAGACYISSLLTILRDRFHSVGMRLSQIEFLGPAFVLQPVRMQTILQKGVQGTYKVKIRSCLESNKTKRFSLDDRSWITHVSGILHPNQTTEFKKSKYEVPLESPEEYGTSWKNKAESLRLKLGPRFEWIQEIHTTRNMVKLRSPIGNELNSAEYVLFPGLIDGVVTSMLSLLPKMEVLHVPVSVELFDYDPAKGIPSWVFVEFLPDKFGVQMADLTLLLDTGVVVGEIRGLTVRAVNEEVFSKIDDSYHKTQLLDLFYTPEWIESEIQDMNLDKQESNWLIFTHEQSSLANGICVFPADSLSKSDNKINLRPDNKDDYVQMLGQFGLKFSNIVYAWAVDTPTNMDGIVLKSLVYLTQAVIECFTDQIPAIFVATKALNSPVPNFQKLYNATLIGYCKSIQQEHPMLKLHHIDVIDGSVSNIVSLGQKELLELEPTIAFVNGKRFVSRLKRFDLSTNTRYF